MANIKSAKKRILITEKRTAINKKRTSEVKTYTKKFYEALENENIAEAQELIKVIDKKLKKAAQHNLIHNNKADRELSKLTKKLNNAM